MNITDINNFEDALNLKENIERASGVALKEEEVILGPGDHLPQCLGHTWGYVRHCNRGTGTRDLH